MQLGSEKESNKKFKMYSAINTNLQRHLEDRAN